MHTHRDIVTVIDELHRAHPGIACEQLRVAHAGATTTVPPSWNIARRGVQKIDA